MTGRELYIIYVDALALRHCEIDAWEDLSPEDQQDWNFAAEEVTRRFAAAYLTK